MKINKSRIIQFGIIVSLLGIFLSIYLWWFQVTEHLIPCTDSGCEHVLKSDYSKIFGVPMAVFGAFYYVCVAYTLVQKLMIKSWLIDKVYALLLIWGIIFSAYLRYLEFFIIGQICVWCWVSVFIILILVVLNLVEKKLKD